MSRNVIGLDLSLAATGIAVWNNRKGCIFGREVKTKADVQIEARIHAIRVAIVEAVVEYTPHLAVIEDYAYGKARFGGQRILQLAELAGVIKSCLFLSDTVFYLYSPTALKKSATGFGDADKDLMISIARRYWPECPTDNVADAIHLAHYGSDTYNNLVEAG